MTYQGKLELWQKPVSPHQFVSTALLLILIRKLLYCDGSDARDGHFVMFAYLLDAPYIDLLLPKPRATLRPWFSQRIQSRKLCIAFQKQCHGNTVTLAITFMLELKN